MNDRDKLTTLLNDFGIGYELEELAVVCKANEGGVKGYIGFVTVWAFTPDGKFTEMGIWE